MISRIKIFVIFCFLFFAGWIGWNGYFYFFESQEPRVNIEGIENQRSYAGTMTCSIDGEHVYKILQLSVWLDNHPLINSFKVNKDRFKHVFDINTKQLQQGKHHIKIEAIAGNFKKEISVLSRDFYVDNTPLQAAFVRPDSIYKVFQGRTLHVQFQVNKPIDRATITTLSKTFKCFPESENSLIYECFVPVDCEEQPNEYLFSININDVVGNKITLTNKLLVVKFPFKKQTVSISSDRLKQEEELGEDSKVLTEKIDKLSKLSPSKKLWHGEFCTPLDVTRVVCEFGTVRTTQYKGRYSHRALDVVTNMPKSVIWATQDGIVVVKERFVETGNTIVLDHGCGVFTLLCHLDEFAKVEEGQKVKKGNPVGTMGKTGYATGYHLHWAMFIDGIPIDPMQWVKQKF